LRTIANQYSVVSFLGLAALSLSLGYGAITGDLLSPNAFITALRVLGFSFMLGGLAMWLAVRRAEAGKPGLNPLLVSTVLIGLLASVVSLFLAYTDLGPAFWWGGFIVNVLAVVIALFIVIIDPAFEKPVTKVWPEGGEPQLAHAHAGAAHAHAHEADEPVEVVQDPVDRGPEESAPAGLDNLTRIEGIGPKIQSILSAAGIDTFQKVSKTTPEHITTVLKDAGFKAPFNAASWPEQAALAANGDWEALDKLQGELSAGRRK